MLLFTRLLLVVLAASVPFAQGASLNEDFNWDIHNLFSPEAEAVLKKKLTILGSQLKDTTFSAAYQTTRKLQVRDCNAESSTATADEIRAIANLFLGLILPPGLLTVAAEKLLSIIDYDIAVSKVCLSCQDVDQSDLDAATFTDDSTHGFASYCSSGKYGVNATHSALVFAPIDPDTGDVFTGVLRGFVSGHSTESNVNAGPSDLWPVDITAALASDVITDIQKVVQFRNFLTSSVAASAGAISVMPDYIGYGESKSFDRAFLAPLPYRQAFSISYIAAKRYISASSQGCTVLDDVATLSGYSEGGYASVVGAMALEQIGVQILSLRPGGAPYEPDIQAGFTADTVDSNPVQPLSIQLTLPYLGYGYSNDFPFLANTGTDVILLSDEWSNSSNFDQNVVDWFDAPDPLSPAQILQRVPSDLSDLLNPDVVELYRDAIAVGILGACREGTNVTAATQPICEAFLESGLWDVLDDDVSFPTSICHSPQDDVAGYDNVPDLSSNFNPNVQLYTPILAALAPQGSHDVAYILCAIDPIANIAFTPPGANSPVFRSPLPSPPEQCTAKSDAPSTNPSATPSTSPSAMPSTNPSAMPSTSPSATPSTSPSATPSTSPSTSPSGPPSQQCGGVYEVCGGEDSMLPSCCSQYVCRVRRMGEASVCSPPRTPPAKMSLAEDARGGQAGKAKGSG